MENMRTIVSGFISPQFSRSTTFPLRAISPEAPASLPAATCSCITVLIRFRRSREKPACSGAPVGRLAPHTSDTTRPKINRIRMSVVISRTPLWGVYHMPLRGGASNCGRRIANPPQVANLPHSEADRHGRVAGSLAALEAHLKTPHHILRGAITGDATDAAPQPGGILLAGV